MQNNQNRVLLEEISIVGPRMSKMGSVSVSVSEEYVDLLLQEFAYDPVRLQRTEDPAQILYNRKTLEIIWDAKHEALNPYTRHPLTSVMSFPRLS